MPPPRPLSGLAALSAGERAVLRLLAEGHTAKSAAAELGVTPDAVYGRLREARRKTGAGSSRELASLVRAADAPPKIGDALLEVAPPLRRAEPAAEPRGRTPAPGGLGVVLAMTLLASAAGALAATLVANAYAPPAPPHVVATSPAEDGVVRPGPFRLSVTFDRPMRPDSYSFVTLGPDTFPRCDGQPTVSPDRRTFTLACTAQAGRRYAVGVNVGRFRHFTAADTGAAAAPAVLRFSSR